MQLAKGARVPDPDPSNLPAWVAGLASTGAGAWLLRLWGRQQRYEAQHDAIVARIDHADERLDRVDRALEATRDAALEAQRETRNIKVALAELGTELRAERASLSTELRRLAAEVAKRNQGGAA